MHRLIVGILLQAAWIIGPGGEMVPVYDQSQAPAAIQRQLERDWGLTERRVQPHSHPQPQRDILDGTVVPAERWDFDYE